MKSFTFIINNKIMTSEYRPTNILIESSKGQRYQTRALLQQCDIQDVWNVFERPQKGTQVNV